MSEAEPSPTCEQAEFLADVVAGLSRSPKSIPGKYLWDEAGSVLFDRICDSEDYYPTRRETALLQATAAEIAGLVGPGATVVEFGSGASHKIRILLDTLVSATEYIAVDISGDYLAAAVARLAVDYPEVKIIPVVADYTRPFTLPIAHDGQSVVGFFPGSTIGTFDAQEAVAFLRRIREAMGSSWLLLGADPNRDPVSLAKAYGDNAGLMAALHGNVLTRIARELGGAIDGSNFIHEARIFDDPPRVEAHLVAQRAADGHLGGHVFRFEAGESIRTDFSFKYTAETFRRLASKAGWEPVRHWTDPDGLFNLHLLRC